MSNSLEDYIEAVRNIELEKGCATVGEIAESLNVKKPSASLAMKQLKERGLVEYTQYSPIVLTREGRYYADRVISCHTMVKEFLITVLKMEEKRADEVACCIEHIMTLEEISLSFQLLTDRCRERRIKILPHDFPGGTVHEGMAHPLFFLLRTPDQRKASAARTDVHCGSVVEERGKRPG